MLSLKLAYTCNNNCDTSKIWATINLPLRRLCYQGNKYPKLDEGGSYRL